MRRAQDRARSTRSRKIGARSAMIKSRALGALKLAREARDENVPAKRADFLYVNQDILLLIVISIAFNYWNMIYSRKDIAEYFCWFKNSRQISCKKQIIYYCGNMRAATNSSLTISAFAYM